MATLVYDGDCGFCTRSAAWVEARARGSLVVVPWQRADLALLGLTEEECRSAVQLVDDSGRWSGGQAVARALRACRAPYPAVGALLGWRPLGPVVERGYVWVAARRHRLPGATEACSLDRDEGSARGVDGQGDGSAVAPADR